MRPLLLRALLFLLVFAIGVGIAYNLVKPSDELPIYTPGELDPRLVDSSLRRSFDEHRILDFSLTDQSGRKVTGADVEGKVVLADFFFTTCGSICPRMSAQLERVQ
ncbi:MAG TPA: SCO family protein, partial [Flavobacteriales bacterium]|nr:SCO family protein [Flavobacteriales bacterium]